MIAVYAPQRRSLAFHGLSKVERCPRVNHLFSPAFFLPHPFPSFLLPPFVVFVSGTASSLTVCYRRHYCKSQGHRSTTWHNKTKGYRLLSADHYRTTVFDVRCVRSRNRERVRLSFLLRHSSVILLPATGTSSARSWTTLRCRVNLRAGGIANR